MFIIKPLLRLMAWFILHLKHWCYTNIYFHLYHFFFLKTTMPVLNRMRASLLCRYKSCFLVFRLYESCWIGRASCKRGWASMQRVTQAGSIHWARFDTSRSHTCDSTSTLSRRHRADSVRQVTKFHLERWSELVGYDTKPINRRGNLVQLADECARVLDMRDIASIGCL